MSDPKTTPEGEARPTSTDDAVARANEGLADAEAARRDAVAEPVVVEETVVERTVADTETVDDPRPVVEEEEVAWYDRPLEETPGADAPEDTRHEDVRREDAVRDEPAPAGAVAAGAVAAGATGGTAATRSREEAASAPTEAYTPPTDTYVAPSAAAQPIFVQAPEAPRPRGNRGAAGAIGLVAAVAFAVLLFAVMFVTTVVFVEVAAGDLVELSLNIVTSWQFWTPVVTFFLGFWLLGALLNRAKWAHWVIWGLLVGVAAYVGYLIGALFQAPFWELTAGQGRDLLTAQMFAPYAIFAFVIGRELTIWFGAWVSRRGKRISELNAEAQREYERTLEAGPQLYQQ